MAEDQDKLIIDPELNDGAPTVPGTPHTAAKVIQEIAYDDSAVEAVAHRLDISPARIVAALEASAELLKKPWVPAKKEVPAQRADRPIPKTIHMPPPPWTRGKFCSLRGWIEAILEHSMDNSPEKWVGADDGDYYWMIRTGCEPVFLLLSKEDLQDEDGWDIEVSEDARQLLKDVDLLAIALNNHLIQIISGVVVLSMPLRRFHEKFGMGVETVPGDILLSYSSAVVRVDPGTN